MPRPLIEGKVRKGGRNEPNTSDKRPTPPKGSGGAEQRYVIPFVDRDGVEPSEERIRKAIENSERAQRLTGLYPITSDGWEKIGVILMDMLEKERKEKR